MSGLFGLWDKECARCGRNDSYPNVTFHKHHVLRRSQGGTKVDTVDLCAECHIWVHNNIKKAKKLGLLVDGVTAH